MCQFGRRITYSETDKMGVANHSNDIRTIEEAHWSG